MLLEADPLIGMVNPTSLLPFQLLQQRKRVRSRRLSRSLVLHYCDVLYPLLIDFWAHLHGSGSQRVPSSGSP